jgi:PAS domain S-box-containing protein
MKAVENADQRASYRLVLIFAILSLGIVTVGTLYYRNYERQFRAEAEHQLTAIADLKMEDLMQYRKERLWDTAVFLNNDAFSVLVQRFLKDPEDVDAQWQIQEWAGKIMATDQYDHVRLLDAQGVTRLSSPVGLPPVSSVVSQRIPEILRSDQVTFQDFRRNEHDQRVYLDIMVPIFEEQDVHRPLGVFYLCIDPDKYLYPFIQRWPVPSETAETLLVRRDGNDVLYLNELKFQTNSALNLRISLENTNVPAVKAVLGQEGIVEGRDYRGAPVLAALHAIPDSPWFLVARRDTAEVFAPMRERLWQVVVMICVLLFGSGACVGLVWRQQRSRFYRAQYESAEALRRSETKFRTLYDSTRDAVMLLDTKGFFDCNQATLAMFGCATREEFCSKHPADVSPLMQPDGTDSLMRINQEIATALKKGTDHFEWMHKRIDTGETFPAEVLLSAMELDGKPVLQAVVRDITTRKQNEAERDMLIHDLQDALANVKSLSGLLPICASCKKIRDDKGYWSQVEGYIQKHSDATFTHGMCPDCLKKLYPDLVEGGLGSSPKEAT